MGASLGLVGVLVLGAFLRPSYWPGEDGRWSTSPEYGRRIPVVDHFGGTARFREHRDRAIDWWNRAGADLRLILGHSEEDYGRGTITIVLDEMGPYGWYDAEGGFGFVAFARGDGDAPTIAHELGHALGFGHTGRARSIMSQWNTWGRDGVGTIDARGLRHYYGRRR